MGKASSARRRARRDATVSVRTFNMHSRPIEPLVLDTGHVCMECGSAITRRFGRWRHDGYPMSAFSIRGC